ncbi:ribokinase [Tateyamaria omphalii]|uniref:carbohydrate kinase family protein n=1 Tax=Tateyamaria omphalii TaxID=299262 RepID=UPI0016799BE2|nr:carbohydrate kinase family protein [Tateyamaria omphalii]GGX67591.1 ribokinase [Tateyamaria omphalii]
MTDLSHPSVLCVGRLYCDLIFTELPHLPRLGEEVFAPGFSMHAGGGAFITAATIQALGHRAGLCATFPAAPFTDTVLRDIERAGVDATLCDAAAEGQSPQITVASVLDDDRAFLTHASGSALPDTPWPSDWSHLHIGELRTLAEHPDLVARARAHNMTISLDCGWDDALVHKGAEMEPLISKVDLFLPNASEIATLRSSGLRHDAAPITVTKEGAKGARVESESGTYECPARPVKVVDTTGAGDAFNGGFLVAWLSGADLPHALSAGVSCGAVAVGHVGGTGGLTGLHHIPIEAAE